MDKKHKISLLILIIVMGFSISVFYHYAQGFYLGKPYPQNSFLFIPGDKFNDFYNPIRISADLNPFIMDKIVYLGGLAPFGYYVAYLFSLIKPWELSWWMFLLVFFIIFILMVKHYLYGLRSKPSTYQLLVIFVLVFLTYPVLFAVDRSNFDLLICAFLFLFAFAYKNKNFKISTVFLALAIAIKPFACVFTIVYLLNKQFKATALLIFNVIFLTVFSLSIFKDGLLVEIQKYITTSMIVNKQILYGLISRFSSDLYNFTIIMVRSISKLFGSEINLMGNSTFIIWYTVAAIIVFICFTIYLWRRPQPLWKGLAILTILLILLPYTSGDYRLTYLFVPLLMYIASNNKSRLDMPIIILWGLLLIPKNYYTISGDQNIGMVINPLLLIGLLILLACGRTPKVIPENKNALQPVVQ